VRNYFLLRKMDKTEKESLDLIQDWISECDVNERGISFEFFDTDAQDLMVLVKSIIKKVRETSLL